MEGSGVPRVTTQPRVGVRGVTDGAGGGQEMPPSTSECLWGAGAWAGRGALGWGWWRGCSTQRPVLAPAPVRAAGGTHGAVAAPITPLPGPNGPPQGSPWHPRAGSRVPDRVASLALGDTAILVASGQAMAVVVVAGGGRWAAGAAGGPSGLALVGGLRLDPPGCWNGTCLTPVPPPGAGGLLGSETRLSWREAGLCRGVQGGEPGSLHEIWCWG